MLRRVGLHLVGGVGKGGKGHILSHLGEFKLLPRSYKIGLAYFMCSYVKHS